MLAHSGSPTHSVPNAFLQLPCPSHAWDCEPQPGPCWPAGTGVQVNPLLGPHTWQVPAHGTAQQTESSEQWPVTHASSAPQATPSIDLHAPLPSQAWEPVHRAWGDVSGTPAAMAAQWPEPHSSHGPLQGASQHTPSGAQKPLAHPLASFLHAAPFGKPPALP